MPASKDLEDVISSEKRGSHSPVSEKENGRKENEFPSENENSNDNPSTKTWIIALLVSCVMGLIFGALFVKSRVFIPRNIRGQFLFRKWIMLKMFIGAMGTGALCVALGSFIVPQKFESARESWKIVGQTSLFTLIFGALLLGIGMVISGACPGMVIAQIGAGVPNSLYTVLGGLSGAFAYGLLHPITQRINEMFKNLGCFAFDEVYIDKLEMFAEYSYAQIASSLGVICIIFALLLEFIIPYETEDSTNFSWPPALSGFCLGFLQLPAVIFLTTFLGSATCYQDLVSISISPILCWKPVASIWEYMAYFLKPRIQTWWQIIYIASSILSAYLIERFSHDNYGKVPGIKNVWEAYIGGLIMLFGARMAGGCTSGHGISGCPILMIYS